MRAPMVVVKLVLIAPGLLVSGGVALLVLALLPPALGLLGFAAAAAALGVLAAGGFQGPAVQVLTRARRATGGERVVLAPILSGLGGTGMPTAALFVRRAPRAQAPPAMVIGRSRLVVTPWLVEATYRGWVSQPEATALVLHATGRHRAGRHRLELAVLTATVPWRAVTAVARRIGRRCGWLPFLRFAWSLRGVVGAVAVVQSALEARTVYGLIAGGFVTLTYLVPAAARALERHVEAAADRLVAAHGLGEVFAGLLRRSRVPVSAARLQRLQGSGCRPPPPPVPVFPPAVFSAN
jgi:hypothetical protein